MSKPTVWVVAGCNGSGKSTFSKLLVTSTPTFDYDFHFLKFYKDLHDSDIRDVMAHNKARQELKDQVGNTISQNQDFSYETNFNSTPLYWPTKFKEAGFELNMIYLYLNSLDEAKRRVTIRVQNGGHFVPDDEIQQRYFDGFSNLNEHFRFFDNIHMFDSSGYESPPTHLLSVQNGDLASLTNFPDHLKELIPDIAASLKKYAKKM